MPQPKSTPENRASAPEEGSAKREQIARLLLPLELVLLTRDRIQSVLDEAVARGRMTGTDATELASTLVERGRRQSEDLLSDIEQLLGRRRDQLDESGDDASGAKGGVTDSTDQVMREIDRSRRAAGTGASFPISNYDDLTAARVTGRLGELTPAELRKVRDYEQRNANRKSVLAAVDHKLP